MQLITFNYNSIAFVIDPTLVDTWEIDERNLKIMYLTYFQPRKRRNVENYCPLNIRFVAKTSDIRNFSQNIRSHVKTSEMATLVPAALQHSIISSPPFTALTLSVAMGVRRGENGHLPPWKRKLGLRSKYFWRRWNQEFNSDHWG